MLEKFIMHMSTCAMLGSTIYLYQNHCLLLLIKMLGRQTWLDEAVFESSKVGRRIFAKTKLQATSFLTKSQLVTQIIPSFLITQLKGLGTKALGVGSSSSQNPNRSTYHQSRNGLLAPCCTSFMPANGPKAVLEIIIGTRHISNIIGVEQTRSIMSSDFPKPCDHISQSDDLVLVFLHDADLCLQLRRYLRSIEVTMVLQDIGYLMNPLIRDLESWPDLLGGA